MGRIWFWPFGLGREVQRYAAFMRRSPRSRTFEALGAEDV